VLSFQALKQIKHEAKSLQIRSDQRNIGYIKY